MRLYSLEHLWLALDGHHYYIGLTQYGQESIGDIVFIEFMNTHSVIPMNEAACVIESSKTASDIIAPCDLEIYENNVCLVTDPGLINRSAEDEGWLMRVNITEHAIQTIQHSWMNRDAYMQYIAHL